MFDYNGTFYIFSHLFSLNFQYFGFQAYWDETSKQVYYGNTITAETTWTRPTK